MHKHVAPLALALFSMSITTYAQLVVAPRPQAIVPGAQPGSAIVPGGRSAPVVETPAPAGSSRSGSRPGVPSASSSAGRIANSPQTIEAIVTPALRGSSRVGEQSPAQRSRPAGEPASVGGAPRIAPSSPASPSGARAARPRVTTTERPTTDHFAEEVLRRMARTPESAPLARRIDNLDGAQGRTTSPMEAQTAYQARLVTNSLPHGSPAQKTAAAEAIVSIAERLKSAPLSHNIERLQNCLEGSPLAVHTLNLLPEIARALPANANALTSLDRTVIIETVATAQARLMGGSATDPHNVAAAEQLIDPSLCGPLSGMGRR